MADNTTLNAGSGGDTFAADDIGGVKYPRSKIVIGADGTNDGDVSSANPMPISGVVTVSGGVAVTGTFWQATQPVSAASLPLPSGAATAANQDTGNTHLNRLAGKYVDFDTGAGTDSAVALGILLPANGGAVLGGTTTNPLVVTNGVGGFALETGGNLDLITAHLDAIANSVAQENTLASIQEIAGFQAGYLESIEATNGEMSSVFGAQADAAATAGGAGTVSSKLRLLTTLMNTLASIVSSGRAAVNPIAGQAGVAAGSGSVSALTQRMVLATDDPAVTSLQLLDDAVFTDDAAFTPGTSKVIGIGMQADESSTDSVDEGDVGCPRMTLDRKAIVTIQPHTAGGWDTANMTSGDTFTALTNSAQAIKASAGKLGGWYIYNPNATAAYVILYDVASGSVTVGTTTPKLVLCIPATSAANLEMVNGIAFGTAISVAAATTGGGNSAPSTALEANFWYK